MSARHESGHKVSEKVRQSAWRERFTLLGSRVARYGITLLGALLPKRRKRRWERADAIRARLAAEVAQQASLVETIISSVPDGIALGSADGHIEQLNAAARRILGAGGADTVGQEMRDIAYTPIVRYLDGTLVSPEELPLARAARGETFSGQELLIATPSGEMLVSCRGAPIRGATGEITGTVAVWSDVTERKRTEGLMTRLGHIVDTSSNEVYILDARSLQIVQANEGARRNLGYDQATITTRTLFDLAPGLTEDTLGLLVAPLWTNEQTEVVWEVQFTRRDGTIYPVEMQVYLSRAETPPVFVVIAQDITERHTALRQRETLFREAAQRANELETILASITDGVIVTDATGQVTLENAAAKRLLGRDRVAALAQAGGVSDPQSILAATMPLARAMCGETVEDQVLLVHDPDARTERYLLCSSAPVRATATVVTGAVAVFRDITTIKQVEQLKDEFISVAAHELRTPLTAIKGYAELLERRLGEDDARPRERQSLAVIRKQSERLTRLVNEMLDVSRIEGGWLQLNRELFDLSSLAVETMDNLRVSSDRHAFVLDTKPDIEVYADPSRIEQVLINLLSNAITYSPDGGTITVRIQATDDRIVVSISDQGVGIVPDEMPRLFSRFYRAPQVGVLRSGGMGLGLYISHRIVERHEGTITAESTLGAGSTFTVSLPRTQNARGNQGQ